MSTRPAPPGRIQVPIAGGGPVGLAAAMELNLRGVSCAVIEPRPDVNWLRPRAKTVSARTMEHFRRWGLAEELRKKAPLKVAWSSDIVFCTTLTGREITRFHDAFGLGLTGSDMVAEPGQQAPQPLVEQILRQAVRDARHAALITGWRVTAATQGSPATQGRKPEVESTPVSVTLRDREGRTGSVVADYVLGCDGGRSVIREAIGARFDDSDDGRRSVNVTFRAPRLIRDAIHRTKDREFHGLDLVLGYDYADSPITAHGAGNPGQRLPHRWIAAGDSVFDHLGTGFTLIRCDNLTGKHDDGGLIAAAEEFGVPLTVLDLDGPDWARHFGAALVLVRPDQHVSWSGPPPADPRALIRTAVGWGS